MSSKQTIVLFLFFAFALNAIFCQGQVPVPYNLVVASVTATSVTLAWVPPDSGTGYEITTTDDNKVQVGKKEIINQLSTISTMISSLSSNKRYTFTMRTVSGASFSRGISQQGVTLPKPTAIKSDQTPNKGVVTFTVTFDKANYDNYQYLLELSQNNKLVLQTISPKSEIIVSGLSGQIYSPSATAIKDNYKGEKFTASDITLTGVTEAAVTEPSNPMAQSNGNSIFLYWTVATSGAGYQVTVGSNSVPYYVDGLATSSFTAYYLSPCTEYSFTVRTTSQGSSLSNKISFPGIKTDGPIVDEASAEESVPISGKVTVYWNPFKPIDNCDWLYVIRFNVGEDTLYQAYASGKVSSYELYTVAAARYQVLLNTFLNGEISQGFSTSIVKEAFSPGNVPSNPTNLKVTSQSATTISLSWTPATNVVGYQYTLNNINPKFIIDGGSASGTTILSLQPCQTYTITVSSLTENSVSEGIKIIAHTVPNQPTEFTVDLIQKGVILIRWNPNSHCPAAFYVVASSSNDKLAINADIPHSELFPVRPSTTYSITVTPSFQSLQGLTGITSYSVPSFTQGPAPSDPTNVKVDQKDTSISFTWTASTASTGTVKWYGISVTPVGSKTNAPFLIISTNSYVLSSPVCSVYNVTIKALTADNSSPGVTIYTGTTLPVVTDVVVTNVNGQDGAINVAWKAVTADPSCSFDCIFIQLLETGKKIPYQTAAAAPTSTSVKISFLLSGSTFTVKVFTKKFDLLSTSSADQSITIPVYTTTLAPTTTTTAPPPATILVTLTGRVYDQFKNDLTYTTDLDNNRSALFTSLSYSLCEATKTGLSSSDTYKNAYKSCRVTNFTKGSVVANQEVVLTKSSSLSPKSSQDFKNLAEDITSTILKTSGALYVFGNDLKVTVGNLGNRNVYMMSSTLLLATLLFVNLCNRV